MKSQAVRQADIVRETVLITGASSGIGRAMAFWFARHRPTDLLILSGRDEERLAEVAAELRTAGGCEILFFVADLAERGGAKHLFEAVKNQGLTVSILINNAGANRAGLLRQLTPETISSLLALNVEAPTLLTKLFLPDLTAHRGKLLWVSSTGAYQPGPYTAVYYAAKAYAQSLAEALHYEEGQAVQVSTLCPGTVHSNFSRRSGKTDLPGGLSPEFVADFALPRFLKGKKRIIPGFKNRLAIFFSKFLPAGLLARTVAAIQAPLLREIVQGDRP